MGAMASQITIIIIVYSTVYSGPDQRKHQIHRWPVNSPHKWPVTWKMFPFDDVIITTITSRHNIDYIYICINHTFSKYSRFLEAMLCNASVHHKRTIAWRWGRAVQVWILSNPFDSFVPYMQCIGLQSMADTWKWPRGFIVNSRWNILINITHMKLHSMCMSFITGLSCIYHVYGMWIPSICHDINFISQFIERLDSIWQLWCRSSARGSDNVIPCSHYNDVTMSKIASQITSLTIIYSTVYSDPDQTKHQSPASLAFVREIHRGPVNSPHKWPITRKMFPFDDVIMVSTVTGIRMS